MYNGYLKEFLKAKIEAIKNSGNIDGLNRIIDYFYTVNAPMNFLDGGVSVESEKNMENMLATLESNGINTINISTYDFYSRVRYLEKKFRNGNNK